MTIRELAAHLGVSERLVSKWEAAGDGMTPRPVNQSALDTSLAASSRDAQARFAEMLGLTPVAPLPRPRQGRRSSAESNDQLAPVGDEGRAADVDGPLAYPPPASPENRPARWSSSFLKVTRLLASQRQAIAPDALLALVEAHRDSLAMLFRKASTDAVQIDIGRLLSETSIVASRLWSATGNRTLALASCAYARHLADTIGDTALAATARIFESNLHSEAATLIGADGDLMLGLRMLDEAASMAHCLTPAALARLSAEQAQALAVLNLRGECDRALDRARHAAAEICDDDRTGLFSDWSPTRLLVYEGTCSLLLNDTNKAIDILSTALTESDRDEDNTNVQLAARIDLASAYASSGELAKGCIDLANAYRHLTQIGNRRGIDRARHARKRLDRWRHERPVRELDERMMDADRLLTSDSPVTQSEN